VPLGADARDTAARVRCTHDLNVLGSHAHRRTLSRRRLRPDVGVEAASIQETVARAGCTIAAIERFLEPRNGH
jgi:hypothetical protein